MEDGKIIELYFAREQAAIAETDRKYGPRCRSVSYNILADYEDSEECLNDTYLAAWSSIPPTYPMYLGAYLISIIRKLSITKLRQRCADRRGGGEYALAFEELSDCLRSPHRPDKDYELKELGQEIDRFAEKLSRDDRRIFLCRYWLICPIADIARQTGFSESKIKSSLRRSREKLRRHLYKEGLI